MQVVSSFSSSTPVLSLVPHFMNYARLQRGWTKTTLKQYSSRIRMFARWLGSTATADDFTTGILNRYAHHLGESKWKGVQITNTTIRSHFASIRAFGEWLIRESLIDPDKINPAMRVQLPKKSPPVVKLVDDVLVSELLAACDRIRDERRSIMARAIMSVFLHTGIRRAELLALTPEDVRLNDRILHVQSGKGSKNRDIPLFTETMIALRNWLRVRGRQKAPGLFCYYSERSLGVNGLKSIFEELAAISGHRGERVTCHPFRHNAATWLHNEKGLSIKEVQEILGHATSAQTDKYLSVTLARIKAKIQTMGGRTSTGRDLKEKNTQTQRVGAWSESVRQGVRTVVK